MPFGYYLLVLLQHLAPASASAPTSASAANYHYFVVVRRLPDRALNPHQSHQHLTESSVRSHIRRMRQIWGSNDAHKWSP